MPSTYTGSGIELIAPGEQSGTWNVTTNLNLQIIDRMTSQAGTISLSGTTHTLTVSDGVLSDGQYGVLVFQGSPSGTNTVTISPNTAQRTFFVRNTTAQSVVLSQGAGANVTVPSNTSKIVHTNGSGSGAAVLDITNIVAADISGNSTTATTWQTGRTLTIGGTGKSVNGSANVAWSLSEIGVNNATLTLATSGIATGSQTFTSNQGTNATFTVDVPPTNLSSTDGSAAGPTINSSTGTNVTIPSASTTVSGVVTTGSQSFAGSKTFTSTITGSITGNAGTATALQTARTIGGVSFNGTANINLPGVNQAGTQSTTGNAATATALQTARNINGVSFNGTADITIPTVPSGGIIMWSGAIASIPSGWFLCDGANGTPDLRNRFVVGAGSTYTPGNTGGADTVTLTTAQIPSHTHTATVSDPGHSHTYNGAGQQSNGGGSILTAFFSPNLTTSTATTGITVTNAATGGGGSHENRPPYYALAYIMKS
jgi:hypothetical protein